MNNWYTAKEIAKSLSVVHSTITRRAERENWESQQRLGKGGGYEYHISNLSTSDRKALIAREVEEMLPRLHENKAVSIKPASAYNDSLDAKQRVAADSRSTVVTAIRNMMDQGVNQKSAINTLLTQATIGQLKEINPVLEKALVLSKDARGNSKSNYPSERSILRWLATDVKALAPKAKRPVRIPPWADAFLYCWQRPEKPSINHAYRMFADNFEGTPPSVYAVRRFLEKMGNVAKKRGRMGALELKNTLPFFRRSFDELLPADVYSADGHTFDAEVQHPLHGQAFRPEITTFIDIATRRAVGVSVDLAESSIAVLDALISSCTQAVPALLYVDNGGGYANHLLKDEATGVLARLGCEIKHSLPYSSQARGVIERVHQTLWVDGAKSLPGYIGVDMDKEARLKQFKNSRAAIKHGGRIELLNWSVFMAFVNERMNWYNDRPHSSLPKITDSTGKRRHMSPNECWASHQKKGWQPMLLTPDEAAQTFRPRVTRVVNRGEVKFINNIYFSHELTEWHGETVHMAYDINNPNFVWVYETERGTLICKAEWNANSQSYMPKSVIENARETRAKGRIRRIEVHHQEALDELHGNHVLQHDSGTYIPGLGGITAEIISNYQSTPASEEPVLKAELLSSKEPAAPVENSINDMSTNQRIALYQAYQNGEEIPTHHEWWFSKYSMTKEYTAWARRQEETEEL